MANNDFETRFSADLVETGNKLVGYAAVWNSRSNDLGGFHEVILPGAFDRSLQENGNNLVALVEHDFNKPLARVSNGTLRVTSDTRGLRVEIDPADTSYARDVLALVKRGDLAHMSFRFRPYPGGASMDTRATPLPLRSIRAAEIKEVSVVLNPAYPDTSIAARDLENARAAQVRDVLRAMRLRLAALD